jgi:hypothetical protein
MQQAAGEGCRRP